MDDFLYYCPECESKEVTTLEGSSYFINTGKFFCHSVKCHDLCSPAYCIDCSWQGEKRNLLRRYVVKKKVDNKEKIAKLQAKIKQLEEEDES